MNKSYADGNPNILEISFPWNLGGPWAYKGAPFQIYLMISGE